MGVELTEYKMADPELAKLFGNLREQMMMTSRRQQLIAGKITNLGRSAKHAELVDKEITALPDDMKMYATVGRMFVLTPKQEIRDNLKGEVDAATKAMKDLSAEKDLLQKNYKNKEAEIRELIQQQQKK